VSDAESDFHAPSRIKKGIRMLYHRLTILAAALLLGGATAQAHFLWIVPDAAPSDKRVHVYFSETAEPDDPPLLSRLNGLKLEQLTSDGKRHTLELKRDRDSLVAVPLDNAPAQSFGFTYTYGVHSREGESYLLIYHGRMYPASAANQWNSPPSNQRLPFELIPSLSQGKMTVRVLWKGQPLAAAEMKADPAGGESVEGQCNATGEFSLSASRPGVYAFRAKHVEPIAGARNGKKYSSTRHYSTLVVTVPGKTADKSAVDASARQPANASRRMAMKSKHPVPVATSHTTSAHHGSLPDLPFGITSFGAALVGQDLYVCGGHAGPAHEYDRENHSDAMLKLDLRSPHRWDKLGTVPRLAGMAMVTHGGKIYRVGGFEARNAKGEPDDLHSVADFSRFDPATGRWEALTSLPQGRSSHEAVVVGNQLYVVGGWELRGSEPSFWHDTALQIDLSAKGATWAPIPALPFRRRALSLGEYKGKLYAIGGMQEQGGATTTTYVFDPRSQNWSPGPKLPGEGVEGFGGTAVTCAGRLFATTYSGGINCLSEDGREWREVGRLSRPRFFQRMVPASDSSLIVLGGANMQEGKDLRVEVVSAAFKR
jgi:N-acetylneuraminic acid mutarotase/uncharacterized GH25 family protein